MVILVAAAIVLALFQPWKLWVDDSVDEAAPIGAVQIPGSVAGTEPRTVPSTTTTPRSESTAAAASTLPAPAVPSTTTTSTAVPATTVSAAPAGAAFMSIDHGTSGTVLLLEDATGTRFVRLENLDTSNGPDLFVYISTNPPDGPEGEFDDDYVDLGRLEGNVGNSNYVIPAGTDLSRYASVVIWCDRFNSAFGAAPLS
jgi:hypothetical protein